MDSTRSSVEQRLRDVEERLQRGLKARGFDPAQDGNIALPGPLAKLYLERENLRAEVQALSETDEPDVSGKGS